MIQFYEFRGSLLVEWVVNDNDYLCLGIIKPNQMSTKFKHEPCNVIRCLLLYKVLGTLFGVLTILNDHWLSILLINRIIFLVKCQVKLINLVMRQIGIVLKSYHCNLYVISYILSSCCTNIQIFRWFYNSLLRKNRYLKRGQQDH